MIKPSIFDVRIYGKIANSTLLRQIVHQKVKFFTLIYLYLLYLGRKPFLEGVTHKLEL